MKTVTFACPACDSTNRVSLDERPQSAVCSRCGRQQPLDPAALDAQGHVCRCLICPSQELYVRKDFSQPLGLAIIASGFVAASIAWLLHYSLWTFAILVATALLDAALYLVTGNALHCYRCHCEYRGLEGLDVHDPFDLEVFERHRQQAARLQGAPKDAVRS